MLKDVDDAEQRMAEHVDEPSEWKCGVGTDDIDAIKDTVDEWVTQFYKHQL